MRTNQNSVTYIAKTTFRREGKLFGIKRVDRRSHLYTIGKTGTGKSTMLAGMVLQDIRAGEGLALFDPHGDLVERIVPLVPAWRKQDLIYLNVPDASKVWHFNPLAGVPPERRARAASGIVEVFEKLWSDDWGPRLEHLLRNVIFALLELPGASLATIPRLLSDRGFRRAVVSRVSNPEVVSFWDNEFAGYSPKFRAVVLAPLQNKVGAFLTDPVLRRILSGSRSSFDLRGAMDSRKLLLVNLSKGQIGEGPASLLGSLLLSSLAFTGLERADTPEEIRPDFYVYLDEFHTFATLSLATMLSELRKYRLNLVLAHQYVSQLKPEIRDAVLGNAGTLISFRLGAQDAPLIAREMEPRFDPVDLLKLPNYEIYVKLMIDGMPSRPFSAQTLAELGCIHVARRA